VEKAEATLTDTGPEVTLFEGYIPRRSEAMRPIKTVVHTSEFHLSSACWRIDKIAVLKT